MAEPLEGPKDLVLDHYKICSVCDGEMDNLIPGIMIVRKPGHADMEICGHCLPAMEFNGWKEIARARSL